MGLGAFIAAALSLLIWLVLVAARGGFWKADQRLGNPPALADWPSVVAVIPARDEAETIGRTVASILAQDYPGELSVLVVDDGSTDGTAEAAGHDLRLTVLSGQPLVDGWTGKMWAVSQGVARAGAPDFLWLTDADIIHEPGQLQRLVAKAEGEGRDLVSLMVLLRAVSFWEKLLIPAFVFFFQKLYPFPLVNQPNRTEAAAAGGCMLVRRAALEQAGGITAIRDQVIDDCALARLIKHRTGGGNIWLGLTRRSHSLRAYDDLAEIWRMVARTAFVQLDHSVLKLLGTVVGMAVIYLAPVVALAIGGGAALVGGLALALMMVAFWPTLRLYQASPLWALLLPLAGLLYTLMTISSAQRHWAGRGAAWKGRSYSELRGSGS